MSDRPFVLMARGPSVLLKVTGSIDEEFKFPEIPPCDSLTVDLEGLKIFNSAGIRNWLLWAKGLTGVGAVKLQNCRSRFIDQLGHIRELLPQNALIESFYVPFYDEDNDETKDVRLVRGVDFDANGVRLPTVKSSSGQDMTVDVTDKYFEFLKF